MKKKIQQIVEVLGVLFMLEEKEILTLFQRDKGTDNHTKRKLFIIGALLMPITFGGMLLGFILGYRKFMFPKNLEPYFEDMPGIVRFSMIVGGILIWGVLLLVIALLVLLFKFLFATDLISSSRVFLIYVIANVIACTTLWTLFNSWRVGVQKYFFEQSKFGTARYAKPEEIEPYAGKKGIFIGNDYSFHEKGHILTVAGTRSGKFVSLIAPNLLGVGGYADSWVVVDPKGEATAVTARYQMNRKDRRVIILNPWGEHSELLGESDAYNPLDILKDSNSIHLVDDAGMIAEMIIPVEKSDKDKFFADNARAILTGLLLHLVTSRKESSNNDGLEEDQEAAPDENQDENEEYYQEGELKGEDGETSGFTIVSRPGSDKPDDNSERQIVPAQKGIRRSKNGGQTGEQQEEDQYIEYEEAEDEGSINYDDEISLRTIWEWIRLPKKDWEKLLEDMHVNDDEVNGDIVKKAGNEIMKLMASGERTFGIIMAYLLQATDFIKSPSLQKSMKSDFDPKTLSDGNVTLYIIIPADKLVSHFRWLRLVITTAMRAVVRNKNKRVCFLLDEFATLGYMPEIETALSTYAGYNITLWPILQSLVQLNSVYEKNWESFIGNAAVKQFFGVNDNFTADYISQKIGMASHTKVERNIFKIKNVVANQRLLIMPDEIRRGSADHIFTFIKSLPVTVFDKKPYYLMPKLYDEDEQPVFDDNPFYQRGILERRLTAELRRKIVEWLKIWDEKLTITIYTHWDQETIQYGEEIKDFLGIKGRKVIVKSDCNRRAFMDEADLLHLNPSRPFILIYGLDSLK